MSRTDGAACTPVRQQYEQFPYPPRDPRDEAKRLLPTYLDHLSMINHYGFRGRQDFRRGFRALVAGGGTGDAAVFLGEQIRQTDARIVYLDLSESSMEVARSRAAARGLTNITWEQGSLLDLPRRSWEPFDYVNCVGVLHHLPDPAEGLRALRAVLKDDGAMGLMVYGRYGRTGVYQMQELLRIVNRQAGDDRARLGNARLLLDLLPETNWFQKGRDLVRDHVEMGDAGLYDMLLHSTDRAFSIPEVYELVEGCGLHLAAFELRQRAILTPGVAYRDPGLLKLLAGLPVPRQQAALELFNGTITKHSFYVSARPDAVADLQDADNVPLFHLLPDLGRRLSGEIERNAGRGRMTLSLPRGIQVELEVRPSTAALLNHVDGQRSIRDLTEAARQSLRPRPSRDDVQRDFQRLYDPLNFWDLMLLRHRSVSPPPPVPPLPAA